MVSIKDFRIYFVKSFAYTYTCTWLFLLLIALGLAKVFAFHEVQGFNKWFVLHNIALTLMLGSLAARGLLQLNGADFKGLTYIVGFSHSLMAVTLIWFMLLIKKSFKM